VEVATRYKARKKRFGRRRLTVDLHEQGQHCSVKRVARSMQRQSLQARRSRKFIATTDSKHPYAVSENLLNREFHVEEPDRVWVSDITYLRSDTGWLRSTIIVIIRTVRWANRPLPHSSSSTGKRSELTKRRLRDGLFDKLRVRFLGTIPVFMVGRVQRP
jgi:transposase InsO family protein